MRGGRRGNWSLLSTSPKNRIGERGGSRGGGSGPTDGGSYYLARVQESEEGKRGVATAVLSGKGGEGSLVIRGVRSDEVLHMADLSGEVGFEVPGNGGDIVPSVTVCDVWSTCPQPCNDMLVWRDGIRGLNSARGTDN